MMHAAPQATPAIKMAVRARSMKFRRDQLNDSLGQPLAIAYTSAFWFIRTLSTIGFLPGCRQTNYATPH